MIDDGPDEPRAPGLTTKDRAGRLPSLRWALVLRVVVPLLVVFGGALALTVRSLEREGEARLQEDVALVARALRLPVSDAVERGQEANLVQALESAFRIRRIDGAYVYGSDGERLAAYGAAEPDEPPERLSDLAAGGDRVGEYGSAGGRRVFSYFVPLTDSWGRGLGLLQVTRRRQDVDDHVAGLRRNAFGLLVLGTAIVAFLVLVGHHRAVGGPLRDLGASMERIADGARDHRARVSGPAELASLAADFNGMLDALDRAAEELEHRRRTQERLRRELARSEKLASLGELSAGVAHELGTPLSVVDGLSQRLLRGRELPEPVRARLHDVRDQVRRMEAIIRQLLRFGRAETGRRRLTDPRGIVHGAVAAVREDAQSTGVRIEMDQPRSAGAVQLDRRRFEDAVTHLVRNACQASSGGVVRVGWEVDGEAFSVSVEDDGPGVDDDLRGRIFEPFFTTKGVGRGTGLGLAVVHGVVEDHGGQVTVGRSALGGAQFTIQVPVQPAPTGEPSP